MFRKRRTMILIKGSSDVPAKLAQEIQDNHEIKTIEDSNNGLVMIKARERAKQSLFYLGEVLITECKVMINGALGIGMVKGHQPELAYNLAIIDAAYKASLAETKAWAKILLIEERRLNEQSEAFKNKVLMTKVDFNTMDV